MAYKCAPGQGNGVKCAAPDRSDLAGFAAGASERRNNWVIVGSRESVTGTNYGFLVANQTFEVTGATQAACRAAADAVDARHA